MAGFFSKLFKATEALNKKGQTITTAQELDTYLRGRAGESGSGTYVNEATALRHATSYACVRVLSETFAQVPCSLFKRVDDRTVEVAHDHPVHKLLSGMANERLTAYEFKELMGMYRALWGNGYAFINRVGGDVQELIPIHPSMVTVEVNAAAKETSLDYRFRITLDNGTSRTFSPDEIFHFRGMLSSNQITGMSVIGAARESIGLSIATENYGKGLFKNGANFKFVVETPTVMSEATRERLANNFDNAVGGNNTNKTLFLEEGIKVHPISMPADDAQFLETRGYQRTEVAAIFRVPLHKIGDLSNATYSNIDSQELSFHQSTMGPQYTAFEQVVGRDLLAPEEREQYELNFMPEKIIRADLLTLETVLDSRIKNGTLSPNEARARYGDNPREDGDEYVQVTDINTGSTLPKPEEEPETPEEETEETTDEEQDE